MVVVDPKNEVSCGFSPDSCPHINAAASQAVKNVFSLLGVDVDVPKEVEAFRENLRFGASMRRAADKGFLAITGAIAVAIGAALWVGVVTLLSRAHI